MVILIKTRMFDQASLKKTPVFQPGMNTQNAVSRQHRMNHEKPASLAKLPARDPK
jgi:hypothetical protein